MLSMSERAQPVAPVPLATIRPDEDWVSRLPCASMS
jgi:hypothetical protein